MDALQSGRTESYRVATLSRQPLENEKKTPLDDVKEEPTPKKAPQNSSAPPVANDAVKNDKPKKKGKEPKKAKKKDNLDDLKQEVKMDEHTIPLNELFQRHSVDGEKGLTVAQSEAVLWLEMARMHCPLRRRRPNGSSSAGICSAVSLCCSG
ncbi:hypothetical protein L596_003795 [Steinernema carpocapsae]|uniref:Uncharacterized protein n=1 Tax=Steinernema carpocapsae TaxID=34508 RepID=A0A4V6I853_STECR|nr:hypothetical protein L596_003795 [Steinernema carpocapsae]